MELTAHGIDSRSKCTNYYFKLSNLDKLLMIKHNGKHTYLSFLIAALTFL